MIDSIANEIMMASLLLHTNNVTKIATEIGYKPMLLMNALYRGVETGKLTWNQKNDTLTISSDVEVESLGITEGMQELLEQLEIFITYLNREKKDMSIEEIQMFLGGTPALHIKIAVQASKKLTTYELHDPKDKESVYTFITLTENLDKKFGKKQFDPKKSKAAKVAERVIAEAEDAKE